MWPSAAQLLSNACHVLVDVVRLRPGEGRNEADSEAHSSRLSLAGLVRSSCRPARDSTDSRAQSQRPGGVTMGRFRRVGRRLAFAVSGRGAVRHVERIGSVLGGPGSAAKDQSHRRHLRREPQLRQSVRRLGRRERACERRRRAHDAGRPEPATPYSCLVQQRRQPDVAAASGAARDDPSRRRLQEPFSNTWFTIDNFIRPTPPRVRQLKDSFTFPNGSSTDRALEPAAARATWCTSSTRSSTSSNGGAQDRYVDRKRLCRHGDGRLRHEVAADLSAICIGEAIRTMRSRTTSSRRHSAARSSTTSG